MDPIADVGTDVDDVGDEGSEYGVERLHEEVLQDIEEKLEYTTRILERFIPLLRFQKQYGDIRFFEDQDRQLARAIGFMEDCLEVERLENSRSAEKPSTWGMKLTTMFLRPRPLHEISRASPTRADSS